MVFVKGSSTAISNTFGFGEGGQGASCSITGTATIFCVGGRGGGDGWTGQAAGTANRGNGGDGTGGSALGSAGGSGIVVVGYLTSDVTGLTVTGGTATTDGSYTVRSFTTVGSATFGIS